MSKGGGRTQNVTQTTNSAPWEPQQKYIIDGFERAGDWFDSDKPEYYPGSTVTPFSPQTQQALRMAEQKALGRDPLVQQTTNLLSGVARGGWVGQGGPATNTFKNMVRDRRTGLNALKATAGGRMLNENPHLDGVISNATEAIRDDYLKTVVPGLQGAFGNAGRVGSNSHAQAINDSTDTLADAMAKTSSDIQYQNYAQERQNQLSAAERLMSDGASAAGSLANLRTQERAQQLAANQQLPAMSQLGWDNINRLAAVGASREQLANAQLQDKIQRFNFEQNKDADKIGQYMSLIGGGYGSTGSSVTPHFYNPAASLLSGATGGAALAQMMKINPMYGAAAGGLLGLM